MSCQDRVDVQSVCVCEMKSMYEVVINVIDHTHTHIQREREREREMKSMHEA